MANQITTSKGTYVVFWSLDWYYRWGNWDPEGKWYICKHISLSSNRVFSISHSQLSHSYSRHNSNEFGCLILPPNRKQIRKKNHNVTRIRYDNWWKIKELTTVKEETGGKDIKKNHKMNTHVTKWIAVWWHLI